MRTPRLLLTTAGDRPTGWHAVSAVFAAALSLLSASFLLVPVSASAAAPDLLMRIPDGDLTRGGDADQLNNPWGVAGNPASGHVYVSDLSNRRIDEFTAWGVFVKALGWDVAPQGAPGDTPSDQFEICTTICKSGVEGTGAGQSEHFMGITVAGDGNVYVSEPSSHRVQAFSPAGEFLLMFGGEVNKTTGADVCTKADLEGGDVCGAGIFGTGPGELSFVSAGNYITYNPATDTIFVGDKDRIQEFETDGTFKAQIPFGGALEAFDGETVRSLTSDVTGNLYVALQDAPDIYKLSPTGEPLSPGKPGESKFAVTHPEAVAVDGDGATYAVEGAFLSGAYVLGYDASGNPIEGMKAADEFAAFESDVFPQFQWEDVQGVGVNQCVGSEGPNLYVIHENGKPEENHSYISAYGAAPTGCEDPPLNPPQISDQFATEVGRDEAAVKAEINPRFWADTTYRVQYGIGKCSNGDCTETSAAAVLTGRITNESLRTAGVSLSGLEPGTTYHYRFLAESTGGGPVIGQERTFRTFAATIAPEPCSNDEFRGGPSGALPDCRAYEMVSPVDKEGGEAALWIFRNSARPDEIEIDQAAPSGDRFTYTSSTAFADSESAGFVSQYLAKRLASGWVSKGISPPRTFTPVLATATFHNEFGGFSEDLCTGWLANYSLAPLVTDAIPKYTNLYRQDSCAEPLSYEALTTVVPPARPANLYALRVRGFSDNGSHTVFTANDELHPKAPTLSDPFAPLLYEIVEGELRFVCYLPNGNPSPLPCSVGTRTDSGADYSSHQNAISADGSRIYWTAYSDSQAGVDLGTIYLRLDGQKTLKVSSLVATDPAYFWTAADDGSKAIFTFASGPRQDELYEFDLAKAEAGDPEATKLIAKRVIGPMGASEDLSRVYFASAEDLDGAGEGSKGARNLYLYEADPGGDAGSFSFIMALAEKDVLAANAAGNLQRRVKPIGLSPGNRGARISPDGNYAVFMSFAGPTPTGFDNRDLAIREPAAEVYRYDAEAKELLCVSCNPTGVRPEGEPFYPLAARIQGWKLNHHAPRVLSDDGSRVFFESYEALSPEDTNGVLDVYQWEEPGSGSCTESSPTFYEANGGCIDLISSGTSDSQSIFLDTDPSGDNVFFGTRSSLVGADTELNDVYVARVGGGFPDPPPPTPACEGQGCAGAGPPAPPDAGAATAAFEGPGNVVKSTPQRCRRGFRKVRRSGKARCVKRKSHKRGRAAR